MIIDDIDCNCQSNIDVFIFTWELHFDSIM